MKHTPGPWRIIEMLQGGPAVAVWGPEDDDHVCTVYERNNARLIAKAPEMYEALKYFVDRVEAHTIHSKTTYAKYKALLEEIDND